MKINTFKQFEAKIEDTGAFPDDWKSKTKDKAMSDIRNKKRPNGNGMDLLNRAYRLQVGKEKELEELALFAINQYYGDIISNIEIDAKLVKPGTAFNQTGKKDTGDFQNKPLSSGDSKEVSANKNVPIKQPSVKSTKNTDIDSESIDVTMDADELKNEIAKRKIANMFMQGNAVASHRILHAPEVSEKLKKISPELFKVYDELMKAIEDIYWNIPEESMLSMWENTPQMMGGFEKVSWEIKKEEEPEFEAFSEDFDMDSFFNNKDEQEPENMEDLKELFDIGTPKIVAVADTFTVLIHEMVKGIYELIATAGISQDADIAAATMGETDTFQDEIEDLKYGVYLKEELLDYIFDTKVIGASDINNLDAYVFGKMMLIPANEFVKFFKGILEKSPISRRKMDEIIQDIVDDFKSYERDLLDADEDDDNDDEIYNTPTKKPEEAKPLNYSTMSKSELEREQDAALDAGDYKLAGEISKYIKESKKYAFKKRV